ncbi:Mitogen-activated protein kinase kinase kinase, partial [Parasponia andersonii]
MSMMVLGMFKVNHNKLGYMLMETLVGVSTIWSSNSSSAGKNLVAQLLDSGNLVLYEDGFSNFSSEVYLWQSFDHPSDTLLAGMKLGWNFETGLELYLTSWKSDNDPSDGDYTFSGFSVSSHTIFQPVVVLNKNEPYYMVEPYVNSVATRITLNHSGVEQRLILNSGSNTEWAVMYSLPYQQCDSYGFCGANSICRISGDPICDRLEGFIPREGFVKIFGVKLPDLLEFELNKSMSLEECKVECLKSCTAYSNSDVRNGGSGCLMWFGRNDNEDIELPLFDLDTTATATKNFSPACMIGVGGFGSVYKGKLSTGQNIAMKRLSKNSGQGLKEFKNEVQLIAKLQHRNLVALLGCCTEGEERMLVYEYMPNKSLDHFIFGLSLLTFTLSILCKSCADCTRIRTLAWEKHFDIIMGIARGLLYLHRDSKLHIVHRDLKISNILLDSNLNHKISDFGLARIFGDDEKEARTRRVMSPEYAIDGKFSVKSDVFSFGVLLLEIVSGKKNRRFSHPDHYHNLLGH